MKAAVLTQFGAPDVLQYTDIETPEPKAGEVRIKILAAGLLPCRDIRWMPRMPTSSP